MIKNLHEAIMQEEETQLNKEMMADGATVANNIDTYKKLSFIDKDDKLSDEEVEDLTEKLNGVEIKDDMPMEEKMNAVIVAVK